MRKERLRLKKLFAMIVIFLVVIIIGTVVLITPTAILMMVMHIYGFNVWHWQIIGFLLASEIVVMIIDLVAPHLVNPDAPHGKIINTIWEVVGAILLTFFVMLLFNDLWFHLPLPGIFTFWLATVYGLTMMVIDRLLPDEAKNQLNR